MALKTVNITGKLYNPDGTPAANATGTAVLTKLEIDNGTVVPSVVSFTTDATGLLDINLWPNERGQAGSRYRLRAKTAKNGIVDTMITVPDSDTPIGLDDVIEAVPYPPVEYSKKILEQAQTAVDEATGKANEASASATSAAASEDNALEYKNTAETAKNEAQSARDKAAQWAENPTDTEVEPGQYSAKHHASKAADSANEAEQSAQAAADSAASIETSTTAAPNKIPKSNTSGKIDSNWIDQTIFIKDPLRQSVEAASGGSYTVVYTPKGQPSFLFRQPAFNLEDVAPGGELGTGLHPAFIFNGVADQEIFIGAYPAAMVNGEVVCQPGRDPAASINFDNARAACQALGPGWDIMSNWDWAAIAFWCMANGFQPRGNTDYGRNHDKRWETGTRVVSDAPGSSTNSNGRTLTGSGPASWAHNNTPGGIHDLVGNVWEWNQGLILDNNIFKVAPDNGTYLESEFIDTAYKAAAAGTFSTRTYVDPPLILKQALAVPASASLAPTGYFYKNAEGVCFASRGSSFNYGSAAGVGALNCSYLRTSVITIVGFRPRFRNL